MWNVSKRRLLDFRSPFWFIARHSTNAGAYLHLEMNLIVRVIFAFQGSRENGSTLLCQIPPSYHALTSEIFGRSKSSFPHSSIWFSNSVYSSFCPSFTIQLIHHSSDGFSLMSFPDYDLSLQSFLCWTQGTFSDRFLTCQHFKRHMKTVLSSVSENSTETPSSF